MKNNTAITPPAFQKRLGILTATVAMLSVCNLNAQDIHFSQINNTNLFQNPANTGAFNGDQRASIHYKNQWASVATPFTTYGFAFDMGTLKKKTKSGFLGVGVVVYNDKAGDNKMQTLNGGLTLAWHQYLNDNNMLSGGIASSVIQNSISPSTMQWDNQYDGTGYNANLSSGETRSFQSILQFSVGGGLLYTYKSKDKTMSSNDGVSANLGGGVYHINQPKYSFYQVTDERQYSKIVVHGGMSIGILNSILAVQPSFLYQSQGSSQEIVAGSMLRYRIQEASHYTGFKSEFALSAGLFYRVKDAMIAQFLFEYSYFAIGVSYDINTSVLNTASNSKGGMELMLKFSNPNPFKATKSSARFL